MRHTILIQNIMSARKNNLFELPEVYFFCVMLRTTLFWIKLILENVLGNERRGTDGELIEKPYWYTFSFYGLWLFLFKLSYAFVSE